MLGSLRLITVALITLLATPAVAECLLPDGPDIPEGRSATQAQMVAGVGAVKAYQAALVEYRHCIDSEIDALGDDDPRNKDRKALLQLYDDSVDLEEAIATRLNSQIRDYKAARK